MQPSLLNSRAARGALVGEFKASLGATGGLFYRVIYDPSDRINRIADVETIGPQRFCDVFNAAAGRGVGVAMLGEDDPARLDVLLDALPGANQFECSALEAMPEGIRRMWTACGIVQAMGTNLFSEHGHLGWFGVLRGQDAPVFDTAALALATARLPTLIDVLHAVHTLDQAPTLAASSVAVLNAAGQLQQGSEAVTRWLEQSGATPRIAQWLRAHRAGEAPPCRTTMGGRLVTFAPLLDGRLMLVFRTHDNPAFPLLQMLSRRQRMVAARAALGHTAQQIGDSLEISAETVRTHLREIYQRLEIESRTELTAMVKKLVT
jgi:DNA-binding NarL/FixJ family response regulator